MAVLLYAWSVKIADRNTASIRVRLDGGFDVYDDGNVGRTVLVCVALSSS